MAVEGSANTWEAEGCVTSNEQRALDRFASRLGSSVCKDEPGIVDAGDVRQEAELLMCLLSPQSSAKLFHSDTDLSALAALSDMSSTSTSEFRLQPRRRREGFAFSCPSLSLDTSFASHSIREHSFTPCSSNDGQNLDCQDSVPPPGVLFSRPLRVDDRDALRLSAEAMARNLLLSYKKGLEWRIQAWVSTLSTIIIRKEQELVRKEATKEDMKKLLETGEAQLIVKLQDVAKRIDVLDARTNFQVLSRRILSSEQTSPSPCKKPKLDDEAPSLFRTETEYKYNVSHVLSMNCVLNLITPAGYSEVALNVPGVITGTFLSTEPGVDESELTAVNVELDTNILASMVEKSCRIVVRSSVEAMAEGAQVEDDDLEEHMTDICLPSLKRNESPSADLASPPEAVIVTPRYPSPPSLYLDADMEDKAALLSIPDEFKAPSGRRRLVSPQPKSPELSGITEFTPRTPQPMQSEIAVPSLISPPLTTSSIEYLEISSRGGPSLPALVEAACAAMKEA